MNKSGATGTKTVQGIDLSTYLQMVAGDKSTCILTVSSKALAGVICVTSGELYDAKTKQNITEDAVSEMLHWKDPLIRYAKPQRKYKRKINKSLGHMILAYANKVDEEEARNEKNKEKRNSAHIPVTGHECTQEKDSFSLVRSSLISIPGVNSFIALDSMGTIVCKGKDTEALDPNFLNYIHYTTMFHFKQESPVNFQFNYENKEKLLVFCQKHATIGLATSAKVDLESVDHRIQPLFLLLFQD